MRKSLWLWKQSTQYRYVKVARKYICSIHTHLFIVCWLCIWCQSTLLRWYSLTDEQDEPCQVKYRLPFWDTTALALSFQLQRSFANALKQFSVEEECAQPWPERQAPSKSGTAWTASPIRMIYLTGGLLEFWNRSWLLFFRRLWHFVPRCFRIWTYRRMLPPCDQIYVNQICESSSIGLIAKRDKGTEAAALALLEAEAPDVPAPLLIDTFEDGDGNSIAFMTQVAGVQAISVLYRMTYQERRQFADDLGAAIAQIRQISKKSKPLFTGISKVRSQGSKIYDPCVGYEVCAPFENEWD